MGRNHTICDGLVRSVIKLSAVVCSPQIHTFAHLPLFIKPDHTPMLGISIWHNNHNKYLPPTFWFVDFWIIPRLHLAEYVLQSHSAVVRQNSLVFAFDPSIIIRKEGHVLIKIGQGIRLNKTHIILTAAAYHKVFSHVSSLFFSMRANGGGEGHRMTECKQ